MLRGSLDCYLRQPTRCYPKPGESQRLPGRHPCRVAASWPCRPSQWILQQIRQRCGQYFDPCAADCPQTGAVNRPGCAQATAQEPIFVAFRAGGRLAFSCRNSPGEHSADFPQHTSMSLAYTDESRFAITWSSSDGTADAAIVTGSHSRQVFRIPTPASNVTDKYVNSLCTRHSTC